MSVLDDIPPLPSGPIDPLKFQIWWQKAITAIKRHETDLQTQLTELQATQRRDSISASFTVPTLVATATDAGSNATITITNHVRHYGDETSVNVTGGTITAQPYSTILAVYYDDSARAGGAVAYHATADLKTAQNNYVAGRHYVATVTTPASGGAANTGGSPPPGSGYTGGGGGGGYVLS